ncbi:pyridoxamine 5'-phosphate oxidase family protein [Olleya sp. Bg11-27]|uniref:pyridoxamine 5'-phosphate oxidase family protein n=1 Tax=Olleya sp. Bg11-27 TaxID=2058135 RepID=UPI000C3008FD|nr:pyridoxamine 5'-phosphate oxidase family protein [Olleya sp. Bg11-27]AUC76490.1 flavin mononucleotide-binding protein [Olleya sp. Bg11-27]
MINKLNIKEKNIILSTNYMGDLGYLYNNEPYITPITYYYNESLNTITCHLSNTDNIKALRKKNVVTLCVSDVNSVSDWKTVLVHGTFKEHTGSAAKLMLHNFSLGVKEILINNEDKKLDFINQFSSKVNRNDIPIIFIIEIDTITGVTK